jgi:hypothetical protein
MEWNPHELYALPCSDEVMGSDEVMAAQRILGMSGDG